MRLEDLSHLPIMGEDFPVEVFEMAEITFRDSVQLSYVAGIIRRGNKHLLYVVNYRKID